MIYTMSEPTVSESFVMHAIYTNAHPFILYKPSGMIWALEYTGTVYRVA